VSRVNVRVMAALAALVAVLGGVAVAGAAAEADAVRGNLRLDGKPLRPELALTPTARSRGLMFRRKAPADGMLFVFPSGTNGGFWMKNTLVPLTIVFFDSTGRRVRKLSMKPCRTDSCPIYVPGKRYRFALELPGGDKRPALKLGPRAELRRLISRST
jgi:uncharacterized membrane protein (UPF0127 family)